MMTLRWTIVVLALHWLGSLLLWPSLPEEVPVRLGEAGEPVEWQALSPLSWFGLPLLSLAVVAALHLVVRWLTRRPLEGLRFPELLVGAAARGGDEAEIKAAFRRKAQAAALVLTSAILLIHVGVYQAAMDRAGMPWMLAGIFLSVLVLPAVLVMGSRSTPRRIDLRRPGDPD